MDNYFTLPKIMKKLRDINIGIVGTARVRVGWPPKELSSLEPKKCEFNEFYHTVDKYGSLISKWMFNGLVAMVSTVHKINNSIERDRRRPRVTSKIKIMWKKSGTKETAKPESAYQQL